jgi:RNA polymerase sigma-70 factor (ECF subfamily)
MSMGLLRTTGVDQNTYLSFLSEYKTVMYRIAYGYLGDETKALDAVDEAVYLGYLHRKEVREPEFLKTWLTRILINECYKILKKSKREVIVEEVPEQPCAQEEMISSLRQSVYELPEELRKVIVLRYFGGYTISEAAKILGIPAGTAATRSRKAMEILRIEISDQKGGMPDEDERAGVE